MDNRYELAEQHGMSKEFVDWFFDEKKDALGDHWFLMMGAMWEGWKGSLEKSDKLPAIKEFIKDSQLPYKIANVLADYDNIDDTTLQTVIWSGYPPEPDGDVYHIEYVSRGNAIVREILKQLDAVKSD